jgi:alanyl-tRNA synthetase
MMTSAQIRQSFLDFFKSKQHTIVPSSSLMPDSPNLLFTNAGMNQFVPIFLGQVKCPYTPGRAADTQKCIRAGGKHNDLDDVGLDTYHHTFFEMLGNWSFGDYFKKEAIAWAWELVIEVWKFPPQRVYATIYQPDKTKNDPADRDQEAWDLWAEKFRSVGLDPDIHIVNGGKKDNFWMMGETGPCGPCTEIHIDLRPGARETSVDEQRSGRELVNGSDARCIEIWNNVFIQYNANPDGTFSPLPAKHVDTGMGFERVTSIIQGTKGLTDFQNAKISNYETDVFRPIFDALEKMSGKTYRSTLPGGQKSPSELGNHAFRSESGLSRSSGQLSESSGQPSGPLGQPSQSSGQSPGPSGQPSQPSGQPAGQSGQLSRPSGQPSQSPGGPAGAFGAEQEAIDIAFRVIADHIRTLSFAIADGIQPGNTDRNYVLRRILRRAVRYGRTLGFHEPFFYKLVDVLAAHMGDVFPEIRAKQKFVSDVIRGEEEVFNKTLDTGLSFLGGILNLKTRVLNVPKSKAFSRLKENIEQLRSLHIDVVDLANTQWLGEDYDAVTEPFSMFLAHDFREYGVMEDSAVVLRIREALEKFGDFWHSKHTAGVTKEEFLKRLNSTLQTIQEWSSKVGVVQGEVAFKLYDTYGFPLDLTELMARERGLTVDTAGFEKLMEEQRARARAAQKKEVIELSQIETKTPTKFVGFEQNGVPAQIVEVVSLKGKAAAILDVSPFYAEMGGQVGDAGYLIRSEDSIGVDVVNTTKSGSTWIHWLSDHDAADGLIKEGAKVNAMVDWNRRAAIQRHHTVTHLLHWALHEVVSKEASQKGSFVGPDKLTFDFNAQPLTPQQLADIEKLVNERVLGNSVVSWTEVPYAEVKSRKDVMQFFGDKYGDTVRVVQIGGHAKQLDGYSMELCGGTHTRATGEIGLFRIVGENAIAAGVRRIEAVAGLNAYDVANQQLHLIKSIAGKINSPVHELEKKVEALLAHQKELEKQLKSAQQREAAGRAKDFLAKARTINGTPALIENIGAADGDTVQSIVDALKSQFKGVIVLGAANDGAVTLIAAVTPEFTAKVQAGKIIQTIAPIVGGKGGGKPDNARGGGKDASKLDEALAKAASLLG